LNFWSNGI